MYCVKGGYNDEDKVLDVEHWAFGLVRLTSPHENCFDRLRQNG